MAHKKRTYSVKKFRSKADGLFYFHLRGPNGEIQLQSEGYTRKDSRNKAVARLGENGLQVQLAFINAVDVG